MLDTVRVGLVVSGVDVPTLVRRGWTWREVRSPTRHELRATHATEEGLRLSYLGGVGWLSAEGSLPRLLRGDNSEVLTTWAECSEALGGVRDRVADLAGVALPEVSEWWVSRMDPVWAWDVDPALYVAALRLSRLPRCEPRSYGTSVSWLTMRGGHVRARCYDKRAEAGRSVDLPLRLERQLRPRREVVRLAGGERVPWTVGELGAEHALGVVSLTMEAVGLDKPIPGPLEARRLLVERWGARKGRNLYRALCEARDLGAWPSDVSPRTRRDYECALREAGVRSLSWEGQLPSLPFKGGLD